MKGSEGPKFLKKTYNLHEEEWGKKAVERKKAKGEKVGQKPEERIQVFLDRFKEITEREDPKERESGIEILKRILIKEYVMTEETIPESFFKRQAQQQRELGLGNIELDEEERGELIKNIIREQRESLESWIDYLTTPEASNYPDWFVYYAFRSILSLGTYNKEKGSFSKRTKETTAPYPRLNQQAFAMALDWVVEKVEGKEEEEEEEKDEHLQTLLKQQNFGKLYAHALETIPEGQYDPEVIEGEWVEYPQGSEAEKLTSTLQSHNHGWCIAGKETAQSYLSKGSIRVYYSHNPTGSPTVPRLAVVEQNNQITEIRGVHTSGDAKQHADPFIQPILDEELERLGQKGERYLKASADMKHLTAIDRKQQKDEPLTPEDLRFLYEIDNPIQGFGYQKDPRIQEILQDRNKKSDLASFFNCTEDQISLTKEEALQGDIVYHYGDLDLRRLSRLPSSEGLNLPKTIGGSLYLRYLTSSRGLQLPETIGGGLYLSNLTSAENLQLPKTIGGGLYLYRLTSAENLQLPETIGGRLDLSGLTSAEGLHLPKTIGGRLYLNSLTSAEGLHLPETIGGDLDLHSLTSAEGLQLPKTIGGGLYLSNLTSAEGLQLPEMIGGDLNLNSLTSAEGLQLPETIGRDLDLRSITSIEGLQLPKMLGRSLLLAGFSSRVIENIRKQYPDLHILHERRRGGRVRRRRRPGRGRR